MARVVCIGVISLGLALAASADWPQFRGPHGLSVSEARSLPDEWNDKTNLAWKVALPGNAWSSPIVWANGCF